MGILQQLTDFPVVSIIKTLHYIEHTAMEMSQSRRSHHDTKDTIEVNENTHADKPGRRQIYNQEKTSGDINDMLEIEQTEESSEIKDVIETEDDIDDIQTSLQRASIYCTPMIGRRSSPYKLMGNTRRPNSHDSKGNSRRPSFYSLNDNTEINIHEQLLLEADFFAKAFPRRAFPAYVADTLSEHVQRQRKPQAVSKNG